MIAIGAVWPLWAGGIAGAAEDIVVTAERRGASVMAIPANVAALGSSTLDALAPQAPSEALNRLAGVAIQRGSGQESLPAVRSPVLTGGQGAGSVLILEDGVPIRAPGFANINQSFELSLPFAEQVELTRGPGSALYGSNAVHGVLNVLTPGPTETRTRLRVMAGDFGRVRGEALHRGPHTLVGLSMLDERGWRDQSGVDLAQAILGFDGALSGATVSARLAAVSLAQETAGFVEGPDAYRTRAAARGNANPEAFRDSRAVRGHVRLDRALTPMLDAQVTAFARWTDTELLLHFFPSRALEETGQTGGGLQSALYWDATPRLDLIAGVDVDVTRGRLREVQSVPTVGTFPQGLHYDYTVEAVTLAAFAQAGLDLGARWRVVAGLRGERQDYDYDNRAPEGDVGRFRRAADRSDAFTAVTPKLGLIRRFGPEASGWLNLARGARSPQAADLYSLQTTQTAGGFEAETIDSAEIGWRKGFANGARLEIAAYAMEKRNAAFRNADGFTVADAATRHRGVEAAGEAPLGAGFTLSGWATYAHHSYRFDDPSARAGEAIRKGAEVDTAPRRLANVQLAWSPRGRFGAEFAATLVGRSFTNAANTRLYPGHAVADVRMWWAPAADWRLDLAVRNATNEAYAERADFAFGQDRYFPGEARAVSLQITRTLSVSAGRSSQ